MPKGQWQQIVIPVSSHMNTALRISVTQGTGADSVEIHNQILWGATNYLVDVTPTDGNVRLNILRIYAPIYDDPYMSVVTFSAPTRSGLQYETRSELAQVCPTPTDPYRFGFNGQQKDNEYAGLGNHNTALFWEYDTRLGRRWNLDPVDQIGMSNYSVLKYNPILYSDPKGDFIPLLIPLIPVIIEGAAVAVTLVTAAYVGHKAGEMYRQYHPPATPLPIAPKHDITSDNAKKWFPQFHCRNIQLGSQSQVSPIRIHKLGLKTDAKGHILNLVNGIMVRMVKLNRRKI